MRLLLSWCEQVIVCRWRGILLGKLPSFDFVDIANTLVIHGVHINSCANSHSRDVYTTFKTKTL